MPDFLDLNKSVPDICSLNVLVAMNFFRSSILLNKALVNMEFPNLANASSFGVMVFY